MKTPCPQNRLAYHLQSIGAWAIVLILLLLVLPWLPDDDAEENT